MQGGRTACQPDPTTHHQHNFEHQNQHPRIAGDDAVCPNPAKPIQPILMMQNKYALPLDAPALSMLHIAFSATRRTEAETYNPIIKMATLVSGRPQHNFLIPYGYKRSSCLFPKGYYIQQATRQGVAHKRQVFSRACGRPTIRSDPRDGKSVITPTA